MFWEARWYTGGDARCAEKCEPLSCVLAERCSIDALRATIARWQAA